MTNNSESKVQTETSILDSSLIVTTNTNGYDVKIVECGDYYQLYWYERKKIKKRKNEDLELNLKINKMFEKEVSCKEESNPKLNSDISIKNITRSKLECQRLAKANMEDWKTFITLTFAENIENLEFANKKFRYFIDKVQRVKKDFKYLCITEFQKRGAVHYHLLTNIDINDNSLMYTQEDNQKFKHIKYWNDGFTSIEVMQGDPKKVVGYISKYMTKDIDNRLFNRHRYFYSRNLKTPKTSYIDINNPKHLEYYKKIIQDSNLIYTNEYINTYDKTEVNFLEYLKK